MRCNLGSVMDFDKTKAGVYVLSNSIVVELHIASYDSWGCARCKVRYPGVAAWWVSIELDKQRILLCRHCYFQELVGVSAIEKDPTNLEKLFAKLTLEQL
jgi:hypothetical protein